MLPLTVQHLTRSSLLVTMLNRMGNGYSSSRIEEYETASATRVLDEVKDDKFIPSNIDTRSPVVFCWDNNDISEETATGAGTTDCTNGIVVQRPLPVAMQPAAKLDTVPRL